MARLAISAIFASFTLAFLAIQTVTAENNDTAVSHDDESDGRSKRSHTFVNPGLINPYDGGRHNGAIGVDGGDGGADGDYFWDFGFGGDKWKWWCWGRWWYRSQPAGCHGECPLGGVGGYDSEGYARVNVPSVPHDLYPRWWFCWGQWWYGRKPAGCQTSRIAPESYHRSKRDVGAQAYPLGGNNFGDRRWNCWGKWWYKRQPNNCHNNVPFNGLDGYDPEGYARVDVLSIPHDLYPKWWFCWDKWWYGTKPRGCQTSPPYPGGDHHIYNPCYLPNCRQPCQKPSCHQPCQIPDCRPPIYPKQTCSFHYYPQPKTWFEADQFCQRNGMKLAILKTRFEQDLAAKTYASSEPYWIGATDSYINGGAEGVWHWTDSSLVGLNSWLPGKPDGGARQNCAQSNWRQPGKWDDAECTLCKPFLCQIC